MIEDKYIFAIILNYNTSKETITLYNQLIKNYNGINIIVIDNNSLKSEKELLKKHIKSNIIFNSKNLGYAGGNNIALKKAIELGAEYVWLLNPDIRINKETLPILIDTIKSNNDIAAVGPRICYRDKENIIYSDGGIVIKEKGFYTDHINYNTDSKLCNNEIREVDYVNGSVILIDVEKLKKIGFMKEDFFLYFEETEWCLRAKDMHHKLIVNPKALAFHKSSIKGKKYIYYMTRNRILLAKLRNEYYKTTLKIVLMPIIHKLKKEIKKRHITSNTIYEIKGFIAGVLYHF